MTELIKHRKLVSLVTGSVSSAFSIVNVIVMGLNNDITLQDIIVDNEAGETVLPVQNLHFLKKKLRQFYIGNKIVMKGYYNFF